MARWARPQLSSSVGQASERAGRTMLSVRWVLPFLLAWPATATAASREFRGDFAVRVVNDTIWTRCEMNIEGGSTRGKVDTTCRRDDSPASRRESQLTGDQVRRLREMLRAADLFAG